MQVITLRALTDNYVFMLLADAGMDAAVVDPGDASPVIRHLRESGRLLTAILITHHHSDHTGGNRALLDRYPGVPVFGGARDRGRIPGQTAFLKDGDEFMVCGAKARVLEVPGHTKAHVAYYFAGDTPHLFSGDTVFGGTIGNLFESTPEAMFESIQKIRALPPQTQIWSAHEYTLQYVRESAGIDPGNKLLAERLRMLESSAASGRPTVPLSLKEECDTNPFFRWDNPELNRHLKKAPGLATFRHLCDIT
jgi:hydroxyacylglutathione hydrolase